MKNNKNVLIAAGVVALLVGAFFAGSVGNNNSTTEPKPQPTNTWTPEPEVPSYSSEEEFLYAVNDMNNSVIAYTSDSDLLDMGWGVCDVLDEGYTLDDIADELIYNSDLSTETEFEAVGIIMAGAVMYLCPEYEYMVDDFINSGSY